MTGWRGTPKIVVIVNGAVAVKVGSNTSKHCKNLFRERVSIQEVLRENDSSSWRALEVIIGVESEPDVH